MVAVLAGALLVGVPVLGGCKSKKGADEPWPTQLAVGQGTGASQSALNLDGGEIDTEFAFEVRNAGDGSLSAVVRVASGPGLRLQGADTEGKLTLTLGARAAASAKALLDREGLAPGTYEGHIRIDGGSGAEGQVAHVWIAYRIPGDPEGDDDTTDDEESEPDIEVEFDLEPGPESDFELTPEREREEEVESTETPDLPIDTEADDNPTDVAEEDAEEEELPPPWRPSGFVRIPAGSFTQGSPTDEAERQADEGPARRVTLTRALWVQVAETTQAEWTEAMGTTPARAGACGPDCPVETVSLYDAMAFANAWSRAAGLPECYDLSRCTGAPGAAGYACPHATFAGLDCTGFRLPTEAEWEYLARAGSTTALANGPLTRPGCTPPDPAADALGWYCANAGNTPRPGKGKQANAWGLHDMAGNVWEWTIDAYAPNYDGLADTDPLREMPPGVPHERVIRGGAFSDFARDLRSARRLSAPATLRYDRVGFRLVRNVTSDEGDAPNAEETPAPPR